MSLFFSLKFKIFVVISFFFILIMTANMFYDLNSSKNQLNQYLANLNKSSAKLLNENINGNLYNLDYTNVKHTVNSFDNEYFKNIYVLTTSGYIFAQRNIDEIIFEKFKNFDSFVKLENKNPFVYFSPITLSNKIIGYLVIKNNDKIIKKINKSTKNRILKIFLIMILATIFVSYLISIIIIKPINNIVKSLKNIDENKTLKFKHSSDEFGSLSKIIEKNYQKIQSLNNNLENKVNEELKKNSQKDKIIQEQDLRASLGEMMDCIAHQWKQPLSVISLLSQELEIKLKIGSLEPADINSAAKTTKLQINHLLNTLDEFRSFFRENKKNETIIIISEVINKTLTLLKNEIMNNKLQITVNCNKEEKVNIIANEFIHILINLINNSKDAFIENEKEDRRININVYNENKKICMEIQDNAGGIPSEIIEHIFDAEVTSKEEGKGTGVGLHMCKMIIEKIGGTIDARNNKDGACFTICLIS